jgi:hypothetical protein
MVYDQRLIQRFYVGKRSRGGRFLTGSSVWPVILFLSMEFLTGVQFPCSPGYHYFIQASGMLYFTGRPGVVILLVSGIPVRLFSGENLSHEI